jgi:HK97 family phage portal protein
MDFLSKFRSKAAVVNNSASYSSSIGVNMPNKIQASNHPVDLMCLNRGLAYSCNNLISRYVSSIPLRLYYVNSKGQKEFVVPHNKSLSKQVTKEINRVAKQKQLAEIVEITKHPMLDLIEQPSSEYDISEFLTIISSYIGIIGNAYAEIIRDGKSIKEINPLRSEYVEVELNDQERITGYLYNPPYAKSRKIALLDMLHFRSSSAGSTCVGYGWMEAAQYSIRLSIEMDVHCTSLANNLGQPGQLVNLKGNFESQEQADAATKNFQEKFGRSNRGKALVTTGDVSVIPLTVSIKDMVYDEQFKRLLTTICSAASVPEDLITSQNANRASSTQATTHFLSYTILPILNVILNAINKQITSEFDEKLYVWYDPSDVVQEDEAVSTKNAIDLVSAGIITIEEARNRLGITL